MLSAPTIALYHAVKGQCTETANVTLSAEAVLQRATGSSLPCPARRLSAHYNAGEPREAAGHDPSRLEGSQMATKNRPRQPKAGQSMRNSSSKAVGEFPRKNALCTMLHYRSAGGANRHMAKAHKDECSSPNSRVCNLFAKFTCETFLVVVYIV